MTRLIDADALLNLPFEKMIHTDFGDTAIPIEEIETAPTVCGNNPKWCENCVSKGKCASTRQQGEWIENSLTIEKTLNCSICGAKPRQSVYGYYLHDNFCPNCGADMREKNTNSV